MKNNIHLYKAGIALVIALAFLLPGTSVLADIPEPSVIINVQETSIPIEEITSQPLLKPRFVYVDDNFNPNTTGWGYDHFADIQSGVTAVARRGTVFVASGMYFEHILISKTITLIGENRDTTNIDGSGSGSVIKITADSVKITGFTITRCGMYEPSAGIEVRSNAVNIIHNKFYANNRDSVELFGSNNVIRDNMITHTSTGVESRDGASYNLIAENDFLDCSSIAVWIHDSNYNVIRSNTMIGNYIGVDICLGVGNLIGGNFVSQSASVGIYLLYRVYNNIIRNNNIVSNSIGMLLYSAPGDSNQIYHNNFVDNNQSAFDELVDSWDNGYPSGGNYWSDYNGTDNNHDGIGDIPYSISGGSNQDRYPLIRPWG